ncbi:hypothetical protein RND81_04G149300 [Saponaria officinalis]|uniref:rRNA N-glycosylase n=1 Tax=Saponaria officinalis TaxID=3572 RepID=A0AAW1LM67_SAPOF
MDVTFNLDDPDVDNMDELGQVFWTRYNTCLISLRQQCRDPIQYHGFDITHGNPIPTCCNLIFEYNYDNVGLIVVTIKYERCSVYFFAFRSGRGEPEPHNNQNNAPWHQCNDYAYIAGAVDTRFPAAYTESDLQITHLSIEILRNAVVGLWFGQNTEACLKTLSVHIAEPVRYRWIADRFQEVIEVNYYGNINFTDMMKEFIKNRRTVSMAIQRHFTLNEPFQIGRPMLQHLTLADATAIMGIIRRCRVAR